MRGRGKYGAKRTKKADRSYDSRAEAAYSDRLRAAQGEGKLAFFLEQVPISLPGDTKLRLDFLEFWNTDEPGTYEIRWVDVKSAPTEAKDTFRIKRRQVEELYPIRIECRDRYGKAVGEHTKEIERDYLSSHMP